MKWLLAAAIATIVSTGASSGAAAAQGSAVFCGPADHAYRCGGILVILEEDATDSIAEVIERQGGNPGTDILQEFQAVRDLLDPDGVADDTSGTTVYSVAVPVGQEEAMAAAYAADPAVYAAAIDRETIGYVTAPDTAMPSPMPGLLMLLCALLVVAAGALALAKRRS